MDDLIVEAYPSREAWLAARSRPDVIGASEAAAALGVHPYLDPWALWERKLRPTAEATSGILRRGQRWESAVLAEYEDASGHVVLTPGRMYEAPGASHIMLSRAERPWLRATPDAFAYSDTDDVIGGVEAKTAFHGHAWTPEQGLVIERWGDGCEALVPAHYAIQVYVLLDVSGMPWWDLCALVPAHGWLEVRWVRFERDPDTQGEIVAALEAWRERHLVQREPPPVDGSRACNRELARRFEARPARVATPEERAILSELASLRRIRRDAEKRTDALTNEMLSRADGSRITLTDAAGSPYGQPQRNAGRETVDIARLRKDFPSVLAACTRQGQPFVTFNLYRFEENDYASVGR